MHASLIRSPRRFVFALLSAGMLLSLAACQESTPSAEASPTEFPIEDLAWSVEEGIVDGERQVLFHYTNHSPYPITQLDVTFSQKEGLSEEEVAQFYTDLQTIFPLTEEEIAELKEQPIAMHAESETIVEPGSSVSDAPCYYYQGIYYVKNLDHYNLVEPDIATIQYIDQETLHTVYYDFHSKKYSVSQDTEPARQWATGSLAGKLPQPEAPVIDVSLDTDTSFLFDAYGISPEQFQSYVETCKTQGYTVNANGFDGYYSAENTAGDSLSLSYTETDHSMSVSLSSPSTAEDPL